MKKLLVFVSLFIVFGASAAPVKLTTESGDFVSNAINSDKLKSIVVRDTVLPGLEEEEEVLVPVPFEKGLIESVINYANADYILPKNLSSQTALDLLTIADYLQIYPLMSASAASFLDNSNSSKLWETGKLNLHKLVPLSMHLDRLFLKDNYTTGGDDEVDGGLIVKYGGFVLGEALKQKGVVIIAPDSKYSWGRFNDGTAQMYDNKGVPVGNPVPNVFNDIKIAPDSTYSWVVSANTAQMYDNRAVPVGSSVPATFNMIVNIAPDSSYSWVKFDFGQGRAQMYGRDGNPIGPQLDNVLSINIAPDSSYSWVMSDNTAQMYDNRGVPVGNPVPAVEVNIAPDSSYSWIKSGNTAQMYDNRGVPVGSPVPNVDNIVIAPDSSYSWIKSGDTIQMYDRNGVPVGSTIKDYVNRNIVIAPDSSYSWIKDVYDWSLYDNKAVPISNDVRASSIVMAPDSTYFWGMFQIGQRGQRVSAQMYDRNGDLVSDIVSNTISPSVTGVIIAPDSSYSWVVSGSTAKMYDRNGDTVGNPVPHVTFHKDIIIAPDSTYGWLGSKPRMYRLFNKVSIEQLLFIKSTKSDGEASLTPVEEFVFTTSLKQYEKGE